MLFIPKVFLFLPYVTYRCFAVTQTINIGLNPNGIPDLSLVGAKVMLDLHDERNEERCKLNSYDLKNREFRNATLDGEKQGMTEITLGGRTALALADR